MCQVGLGTGGRFSEMGVGTNGLAQTLGPRRGSEVSGMG